MGHRGRESPHTRPSHPSLIGHVPQNPELHRYAPQPVGQLSCQESSIIHSPLASAPLPSTLLGLGKRVPFVPWPPLQSHSPPTIYGWLWEAPPLNCSLDFWGFQTSLRI